MSKHNALFFHNSRLLSRNQANSLHNKYHDLIDNMTLNIDADTVIDIANYVEANNIFQEEF